MYEYTLFSRFYVVAVFDLVTRSVLSLLGEIRRYRNDCSYYYYYYYYYYCLFRKTRWAKHVLRRLVPIT